MPWRRGWLCKWLCGPLWSGRGVCGTLRCVSRYVYVSVDVAVRDRVPVCTGRPNLERTQCTTLHIAAAWCETGPTRTRDVAPRPPVRARRYSPRPMVDPNGSR